MSGKKDLQKPKIQLSLFILFLIGILCVAQSFSLLMDSIVISFNGQISTNHVTAASGYWRDIQNAANLAAANGGGTVHIPAGTFDFVVASDGKSNSPWVTAPAGVNIVGAPTTRDANGQVTTYNTILQVPYEASNYAPTDKAGNGFLFFSFSGNGDSRRSRVSDIKFVGYREIKHDSPYWYGAIQMYNIKDWRVDHCFFKHITADTIFVGAPANGVLRGVVDHCRFVNDYGYVYWSLADCSVGYGISINPYSTTKWEPDITKVIGHYTDQMVFVEDCYFSRFRHNICANSGASFVSRYNTFEKDSIVGTLDGHGTYDYVGTRSMEIYNNLIIDPILNGFDNPNLWDSNTPSNGQEGFAINWRGGGGVCFNNFVRNYKFGITFVKEGSVPKCWPNDVWIWNDASANVGYLHQQMTPGWYNVPNVLNLDGQVENQEYFLRAPTLAQDDFTYTPYTYPHPLALEP
jgi:hypothetical protein